MTDAYAGLAVVVFALVALVLYLLTLQRALGRCSPENRVMSPGLVWLQLVPVFGFFWHFRNVWAVGRSLENEHRARGMKTERPLVWLGFTMGFFLIAGYGLMLIAQAGDQLDTRAVSTLPDVSPLALMGSIIALAGIAMTILYWVSVHQASQRIAAPVAPWPAGSGLAFPGGLGAGVCASCGEMVAPGRFCPRCGAPRAAPGAYEAGRQAGAWPAVPAADAPAAAAQPPAVPWRVRDVWWGLLTAAIIVGANYGLLYVLRALSARPDPDLWVALAPTVFYLLFAAAVWWFSVHKHGASARDLGFTRFKGSVLAVGVGLFVALWIFEGAYNYGLARAGLRAQSDWSPLLERLSTLWPLVIGVVVVGPFAEEVFFRGFVFNGLRSRYDWRVAAAISSALFAAFHLELLAFVPLFLTGFLFAYLYQRSNSVWPGLILHMCLNALAMAGYYVALGSS